jgi:citrate synthase
MSAKSASPKSAEERLAGASEWWSTAIIDIEPGKIAIRGYPIQELIGRLGFAQMVWLILRGEIPTPDQAKLLEAALVAAVDHGPHAPSIAIARMAVTCGLPLNGAMASAINALDDIHGGAGQQCMELLAAVDAAAGQRDATEDGVAAVLERYQSEHGKIVPGFGHRWHGVDPRAVRLLQLVAEAEKGGVVAGRFARHVKTVERLLEAQKRSPIPMNIDGATAVLYPSSLRAGARPRHLHPVTLGRHPRPRLGADRAGRTDRGRCRPTFLSLYGAPPRSLDPQ